MRYLVLFAFLGLVIMLAVSLNRTPAPQETAGLLNKPFPVITIASLDGTRTWDANALKGHVTVINFFASWCAPCAEEMPEIVALKQQYPGVHVEGVAWNDAPATVQTWLAKNGNPFSTVWLDAKGDATIALGIKGIPETFVVDGDGIIRYRLPGPLTAELRNREFGTLLTMLQSHALVHSQVGHEL